jgi:hypothetical protein
MAKKTARVEAPSKAETQGEASVHTPCSQCSYPADCARAIKCVKGFK